MTKIINTNIATIQDAEDITLVNNPSFIVFSGKGEISTAIPKFELTVKSFTATEELPAVAQLIFTESISGTKHTIQGTTNKKLLVGNKNYFYLNNDPVITCNNLVQALLANSFFKSNFIFTIINNKLTLQGKRKNPHFSFKLDYNTTFCTANTANYVISNTNTLYNSTVELDVYRNDEFITTVSKSYIDGDVWFDINNILNRVIKSYPTCLFNSNNIVDSGSTMQYKYYSKRIKDFDTEYINFSDYKYVVDGFVRTLEANDIDDYIYSPEIDDEVSILTNNLNRIYNIGEDISANLIVSPKYDADYVGSFKIGLLIKYYENNRLVKEDIIDTDKGENLINSVYITADKIDINDRTQFIDVAFVRIPDESPEDYYEISNYIRYTILRECNDSYGFMFLNKLGGWDIYYFNSDHSTEFKTDATTSFKTIQPNYKVSDTYERVERKEVDETFVIKSMVNKETAEWLKELSTSKYVYSLFDNNRYVIVKDFDLSIGDKDLFEVTMKYTYADTYNTNIK